jgi:hypothetical protein
MKLPVVLVAVLLSVSVGPSAQAPPVVPPNSPEEVASTLALRGQTSGGVSIVPVDATKTRVTLRDEKDNVWVIESPSVAFGRVALGMTLAAKGGTVILPGTTEPVPIFLVTAIFDGDLPVRVRVAVPVQ